MHFLQLNKLKFFSNRELREMYVSTIIRSLAIALIAVFIPIYFYKELGYSLEIIIYFYLVYFIVYSIFNSVSAHISSKIGFKHNILFSSVFYISSFLLLSFLKYNNSLTILFISSILLGIASASYWISFHIDFAKWSVKKYRGQQIAIWQILAGLVSIIAPLVSVAILKLFSFSALFIAGSLLLVISSIPLFFSKDQRVRYHFSYKNVIEKENFKEANSFVVLGIQQLVIGLLWPFLIFLIIADYLEFGFIMTNISILALVSYWAVGKLSDSKKPSTLLKFSSIIHLISSFIMGLVKTVSQIISISLLLIFSITLTETVLTKKMYEIGKKSKNLAGYIVFREVLLNFGKIIFLLTFLAILNIKILEDYAFLIIFLLSGLLGIAHFMRSK